MSYSLLEVPVTGGTLVTGRWDGDPDTAVLAFHGITASHVSWRAVARALAPSLVLAPDLRGRGGSRALIGPFGMAQHAEDGLRVLDAEGVDRVDVAGHSMGAFVAMRFAELYPGRVRSLTLVDGGVPLQLPSGVPILDVMKAALGPALARLGVVYPSREAYREFWRSHPALGPDWNEDVEAYVDYDLVGVPPNLRSSASAEAALGDSLEQGSGTAAEEPWTRVDRPISFLRAPRGLLNEAPLYEPGYLDDFAAAHSNLSIVEVPDVNHYTIVMKPAGAGAVADAITQGRPAQ